jgi:hypothetical protein
MINEEISFGLMHSNTNFLGRVPVHIEHFINGWAIGEQVTDNQGWAKLVLIALERYSVALKRLTFNLR